MKKLFFLILLNGCASISQPLGSENQKAPLHKYKIGDCLMIVDLPRGETSSPHRVRIEKIESNRYYYRWLLERNRWDQGLSSGVGRFDILEKISKKVNDCPK